jgi:hypothetical protein
MVAHNHKKGEPKPYPKRPKMFALHYVRWLIDSGINVRIGPEGFALLVAVAMREDAIFYYRAPDFYNPQLLSASGIGSDSTLNRVRKRLVKEGLLYYVQGEKGVPGIHFVTGFPVNLNEQSDGESGTKAIRKRYESDTKPLASIPFPIPSDPTPKKERSRFVPPSVEQVQEYIKQNGIDINPEGFVDYFESVGWTIGKSNKPMKDWKATVRTWASRDKQNKQVETAMPITTNPIRPLAERARKPK